LEGAVTDNKQTAAAKTTIQKLPAKMMGFVRSVLVDCVVAGEESGTWDANMVETGIPIVC
jgi:NAD-dependent DNA ligase